MFAFTAIQTVNKWRGFGIDRVRGIIEFRLGLIGIAFISGDLWTAHKDLRVRCAKLEAGAEALLEDLQK